MNTQHSARLKLSDYNYQRDIEHRTLLAGMGLFEMEVLKEVVDYSLKFKVAELADYMEVEAGALLQALEKLQVIGLFELEGGCVIVDKEKRKSLLALVRRFDAEFRPDIEFILAALHKVPIHLLPQWYDVPRSTDNLEQSIINRYLSCPKKYGIYLGELKQEDELFHGVIEEVFEAPECLVTASDLKAKFQLDDREFEMLLLRLEYHMVCFTGYRPSESGWEEVVTPFWEWRQHLLSRRAKLPKEVSGKVAPLREGEFPFLNDLSHMIEMLAAPTDRQMLLSGVEGTAKEYQQALLSHLVDLKLADEEEGLYHLTEEGAAWNQKTVQNRAMEVYRYHDSQLLRGVEKSLRPIIERGWVRLQDYLDGFSFPVCNLPPIHLEKKGKHWSYVVPQFTQEQVAQIAEAVTEALYPIGMVNLGLCGDELCFQVTPYGRMV